MKQKNCKTCPACYKDTHYIIEGLCLDCAYKKSQIDKNKITTPFISQGWICPKCGMVHGPKSQICWCSTGELKFTCDSNCHHQVTQDMFRPIVTTHHIGDKK